MKVIFSHGKESGPFGTKIRHLAAIASKLGFAVDSIDYRQSMDPEWRVQHLLGELQHGSGEPPVLVGSSMGGYVATVAASQLPAAGLFVMAPAFYLSGDRDARYVEQNPQAPNCPTALVHGWRDEVVPVDNAIRFAREQRVALHVLDADHGLNTVLAPLGALFQSFLKDLIDD